MESLLKTPTPYHFRGYIKPRLFIKFSHLLRDLILDTAAPTSFNTPESFFGLRFGVKNFVFRGLIP